MCRWVSIMPGMTMPSEASISKVCSGTSSAGPTPAMRPSTARTSASWRTSCASFIVSTVPRRRTTGRPGSGAVGSVVMASGSFRRSRDEDLLAASGGAALALPGVGDLVERPALEVDGDVAAGRVLGQAQVPLAAHVHGREGDREAADVERLRADQRRREDELGTGHVADLDVAGALSGGAHRGERGGAPQHVDRDVDAVARRRADGAGEVVLGVDRDDGVGAAGPEPLEPRAAEVRRDDAPGAEQ